MISASDNLKNIFKQQTTINANMGCLIEYNMNSMIDGITITSATPDTAYTSSISGWPSGKANPYKTLFPIDSIIKPFRPTESGIKYYVLNTSDTSALQVAPYRTVSYPNTKPRIYYPGNSTVYKYWLSAPNTAANLTLNYFTTGLNGNKAAITNKIVIKFEKYHALPVSYTLTLTKSDNTTVLVGPIVPDVSGTEVIYFNGSSWSKTAPAVGSAPASYQTIKSINLNALNPGSNKLIGIIELSARWVKDISNEISDMNISKESSTSTTEILPVGSVTANNISMNMVKFNQTLLQMVAYNRESSEIYPELIYLVKNAELKPHFKIFHSAATDVAGQYDVVNQGVYYINDFNIDQYGETTINGLDGAKYLMETLCPDIVCDSYPATAILRRLLDSVGVSNYNFNLASSETSIPQINYWWTDDRKSVWEAIQELCRDIQMNAFFDESNVLQFYSRDYVYDKTRSHVWQFHQDADGATLPDIISFNKQDTTTGNYAVVRWKSQVTSDYVGQSDQLWTAPTVFLSAGGLKNSIGPTDTEFVLNLTTIDTYSKQQSLYNYNGFVLIDSEIIEYESMGYDCTLLDGSYQHQWISSEADISKYRSLSKSGYSDATNPSETSYFKPSGRYKIKKRGALGTTPASHYSSNIGLNQWTVREVTWNSSAATNFSTSLPSSALDFLYAVKVEQASMTSVKLNFVPPTDTPDSYTVTVQKYLADKITLDGPAIDIVYSQTPPITVENLMPGVSYTFKVKSKKGTTFGNSMTSQMFTLSATSYNGSFISNPVSPTVISAGKSYLALSNISTSKDKYVMAYRSFDGVTLPDSIVNNSYPSYTGYQARTYSDGYFSFGTSIYLDSDFSSSSSSAGLGFFVNNECKTGYYILVETTKSAAASEKKAVRILKADGTNVKILKDSQQTSTNTMAGVFGGKQYNIDVRVKVSGNKIFIYAYINGFVIWAIDTNGMVTASEPNYILPMTKSIALICGNGKVSFDYAYATDISKTKYDQSTTDPNLYIGQLSNDYLDMAFGDIVYNANNSDTLKPATMDDFGTVVREIYHVDTKLNARPAFPIKWSTGENKSVNLLGQKVSNFSAEAYVLNNTSSTVPLNNGSEAMFYIFGNSISESGTLEYSTDTSNQYSNKEPVIFDSIWLQNESDVKKLAEFIRDNAINKSKFIEMEIMGNPLISVGDIITIKYPYQGFAGTEKIIVTNVSQSFSQGINTSIKGRTL